MVLIEHLIELKKQHCYGLRQNATWFLLTAAPRIDNVFRNDNLSAVKNISFLLIK